MKYQIALHLFTSHVHHDIEYLSEVVELTERYLKDEVDHLERRVAKEYTIELYADDYVLLNKEYPQILRRALFTTLMSMTEADLILGCKMCCRAFRISQEFKKKGNDRLIVQALAYLQNQLNIQNQSFKPHWELIQNLWSVRNALVHNDGKPKLLKDIQSISKFCASIPTLELDHHNSIILKEGSVQMALDAVNSFFTELIVEIKRNELPKQGHENDR